MDRADTCQFVGELFRTACMELFEIMQCEIEIIRDHHEFPVDIPLATIDAGSEELETIVLLKMPLSVLAMTYPSSNVADVEEEKLEDWMSEISNQLMGRFKNKLVDYDKVLKIGLPESFFGVETDDMVPEGYQQLTYVMTLDREYVECTLLIDVLTDNVEFTEQIREADVDDGELELF